MEHDIPEDRGILGKISLSELKPQKPPKSQKSRKTSTRTNSKTKTAHAAIAETVLDTESHYLAFDTDGDMVLSGSALQRDDTTLINTSRPGVQAAKQELARSRTKREKVLARETALGVDIVKCTQLDAYILRGGLGEEIQRRLDRSADAKDLVRRADYLVAYCDLIADKVGWDHQAFIVKARGEVTRTDAESSLVPEEGPTRPAPQAAGESEDTDIDENEASTTSSERIV